MEDLSDGGIAEAWDEQWYGRAITLDRHAINLIVFWDERDGSRGLRLMVEAPHVREFNISGWEPDGVEFDGPFHPLLLTDTGPTIDLEPLREDARDALRLLCVPVR